MIDFSKRKQWDDDYVLKRKFSALIPAFDPRPGRTNVNQTTDIAVPGPGEAGPTSPAPGYCPAPRLQLVVRGPNLPGVQDVEVGGNVVGCRKCRLFMIFLCRVFTKTTYKLDCHLNSIKLYGCMGLLCTLYSVHL